MKYPIALSLAFSLSLNILLGASPSPGLKKATIEELSGEVIVRKAESTADKKAALKEVVTGKDVIRTGKKSRAELEFEDQSICRLGSNTIFSFDPQTRDMAFTRGVALVHVPPGKGGARIATPAATAAIQGDTLVVRATVMPDGTPATQFTALSPKGGPTDGNIMVTLNNNPNETFRLEGGQVAIVPSNATSLNQVPRTEIDVGTFMQKSPMLQDLPPSAKRETDMVTVDQGIAFSSGSMQRTEYAIVGNQVVKADAEGNFVPRPAAPFPGSQPPQDGGTPPPSGNIVMADGTVVTPDGTKIAPDGSVTTPDGTTYTSSTLADGTRVMPDGTTVSPTGTVVRPDGTTFSTVAPTGPAPSGDGTMSMMMAGAPMPSDGMMTTAFQPMDSSFGSYTPTAPGTFTDFGQFTTIISDVGMPPPPPPPPPTILYGGNFLASISVSTTFDTSAGTITGLSPGTNFAFDPASFIFSFDRLTLTSTPITINGGNGLRIAVMNNSNVATPLQISGATSFTFSAGTPKNLELVTNNGDMTIGGTMNVNGVTNIRVNSGDATMLAASTLDTSSAGAGNGRSVSIRAENVVVQSITTTGVGGAVGGNGGSVDVFATSGSVSLAGTISTTGGASTTTAAGKGGNVTLDGTSVTFSGATSDIIAGGGNASSTGRGGDGGNVYVYSDGALATVSGVTIQSSGGGSTSGNGGDGGYIYAEGTSIAIPTGANFVARGGDSSGTIGGSGGDITLKAISGGISLVTGADSSIIDVKGDSSSTGGDGGTISLIVPTGNSIIVNDTGGVGGSYDTLTAAAGSGTTSGTVGTISSTGASITLQNDATKVP